jgi:hypothetical protein
MLDVCVHEDPDEIHGGRHDSAVLEIYLFTILFSIADILSKNQPHATYKTGQNRQHV